jgi:RNA polymerase sigma-70 factor (ECF subfamily)
MNPAYVYRTDIETWRDFRSDSQQAFAYLYNRYVVMLYHYGNRLTSDREMIEDCIQDLFIELWQNRAQLGETDSVKFYLFKALKRKLVKRLVNHRKYTIGSFEPEDYDFEIVLSPEFDLITRQVSQEQKDQMVKALNSLTKRQKEAITLKFYDGLSYQEVAVLMAMSVRATYNLIYRAIEVLRSQLDKIVFMLMSVYLA